MKNIVDVRSRDFFDRFIIKLIMDKYNFSEMQALRSFIKSKTYKLFIDKDLELYIGSPYIVFDMWEVEQINGNPRDSLYLRGDEVE